MDGKVFEQSEDGEAAPSGDGGEGEKITIPITLQVTNFESKRQRASQGQE